MGWSRAFLVGLFASAFLVVAAAVAEQHDVRRCKVLEGGNYEALIAFGPRPGEVDKWHWVFSVVIHHGRLRTLLTEGKPGKSWKPSVTAFEPSQPRVSFRHKGDRAFGKLVTVVERAEVFPGDRIVIETWRAWYETLNELTSYEHKRLVLHCPSTGDR